MNIQFNRNAVDYSIGNEELLVLHLKAQNKNAFHYLYSNYSKALYGIVIRIIKIQEDAEDILQDVFVKIAANIIHYDATKGRLFTWMVKIARNRCIDYIRSLSFRNKTKEIKLNDIASLDFTVIQHNFFNPDTIGIRKLTGELSTMQRDVIYLLYFKGYTQPEVAEALGIPLGTVKTRWRQAINELRKKFDTINYSFY